MLTSLALMPLTTEGYFNIADYTLNHFLAGKFFLKLNSCSIMISLYLVCILHMEYSIFLFGLHVLLYLMSLRDNFSTRYFEIFGLGKAVQNLLIAIQLFYLFLLFGGLLNILLTANQKMSNTLS